MIEFLKTLTEEDNYELAERLNFELYPNKGNMGHEFFKYDGFLHMTTWDRRSDCINDNIHNSLVLHDYGILVGDPDKTKLDSYFAYMLEKFGDSWFTSAQEQFQGDKNAKNMILLSHVKEEYEANLAEQNQASENQSGENVKTQTTIPNVSVDSDFAPCDCTDMGL